MRMIDDKRTIGKKYQDKARISSFVAGSRAVAPAGGWVVSVTSMATTAMADDREAASQRNSWNLESGRNSKSLVTQTPIKALMKWPKISARG